MSDAIIKNFNIELQMDPDTAEQFDAALTGNDDDIVLAMEHAAIDHLWKEGYDVDSDPDRRLWLRFIR